MRRADDIAVRAIERALQTAEVSRSTITPSSWPSGYWAACFCLGAREQIGTADSS